MCTWWHAFRACRRWQHPAVQLQMGVQQQLAVLRWSMPGGSLQAAGRQLAGSCRQLAGSWQAAVGSLQAAGRQAVPVALLLEGALTSGMTAVPLNSCCDAAAADLKKEMSAVAVPVAGGVVPVAGGTAVLVVLLFAL